MEHAFSLAVTDVFFWAVPAALIAFALTWLIREIPLREGAHVGVDAEVAVLDPDTVLDEQPAGESQRERRQPAGVSEASTPAG